MPVVKINIERKENEFNAELLGKVKFFADAFTYESETHFLLMNGVNLSFSTSVLEKNIEYCLREYEKKGERFFTDFRGSFCGALFDKVKRKWIVFTNHIGDQKLYYAVTKDNVIISSDIFEITTSLRNLNVKCSLNRNAAYQLLTYGNMLEDNTLVNEISRLTAGHYLVIKEGEIKIDEYYQLNNKPDRSLTEQDCIEGIDELFRKAIQLEYDKDLQYNLNHFTSMSGGLDSRMNNWVARDMGYSKITNHTFSQYNSLDMIISHEINLFLGNEWIFKSLDPGDYLKEIDLPTKISNAQLYYSGGAHVYDMLKVIDFESFGVVHTGQIGDSVVGSFLPSEISYLPTSLKHIKYSSARFLHKINKQDIVDYPNNEIANFQSRGFNGCLTGNFTFQLFTEACSPFLDVNFLDFCLSIPVEKREYHKLYKKWIFQKYPDAANFKWEQINAKLSSPSIIVRNRTLPVKHIPQFVFNALFKIIGKPINSTYSKKHMNPIDYWYKINQDLQYSYHNYYSENSEIIRDDEIKKDCEELFVNGNLTEKIMVLTLISAIKQLKL